MPFSVKCLCGKVFNVKDEMQGRMVRCQVCGAEFMALADVPVQQAAPAAQRAEPEPPPLPVAVPAAGRVCPYCAEQVPAAAVVCPLCKESLATTLDPGEGSRLIAEAVAALDKCVQDPANLAADKTLRGGFLGTRTIVLGALCLTSLVMFVSGIIVGDTEGGVTLTVFGVIFGLIFGISALVSLSHDSAASRIGAATLPSDAYRRFFNACRSRRWKKAFVALAPSGRNSVVVQQPVFDKVANEPEKGSITDLNSFKSYWRSLFHGPSAHVRSVRIKSVTEVKPPTQEGLAVLRAEVTFSSYSKWLYLLLLLNLIVCAIAISIATKRETKTVHKLLIRRGGCWYLAESEFEGALDKAAAAIVNAPLAAGARPAAAT